MRPRRITQGTLGGFAHGRASRGRDSLPGARQPVPIRRFSTFDFRLSTFSPPRHLHSSTIPQMYLERTPSLIYNCYVSGERNSLHASSRSQPRVLRAVLLFLHGQVLYDPRLRRWWCNDSKTNALQTLCFHIVRRRRRANPRLFCYFRILAEKQGGGGPLSKIPESQCEASNANEHSTPGQSATITFTSRALWRVVGDRSRLAQHRLLAAGHRSLSCATLPSQRKRLCDPHVPASRSSSSSFSSAHRMGMRVRWWLSGPVGPAES